MFYLYLCNTDNFRSGDGILSTRRESVHVEVVSRLDGKSTRNREDDKSSFNKSAKSGAMSAKFIPQKNPNKTSFIDMEEEEPKIMGKDLNG